jgi:iron(III) transport system permease protein
VKSPAKSWVVGIILAAVFAATVAYPLWMMAYTSLRAGETITFSRYMQLFDATARGNLEAIGNSVLVSVLSVAGSALLGLFLAFTFTQFDFPFRSLMRRLAILPVALPPLVGVIAFLFVFGETGILPRCAQRLFGLAEAPFAVRGIGGVLLVHIYSFHVYFYLLCSSALQRIDGAQLDAAAGMGSRSFRTFTAIVFPELKPALIGASALTFMSSMASFTAPLLFAGDSRFLTLQIYQTKLNGDMELAAAQSVLLAAVALSFYAILLRTERRERRHSPGKGGGKTGVLRVGASVRRVFLAVAFVVLLLELLPVGVIGILSFAQEGSWTTQLIPSAYGWSNYAALFGEGSMLEPVVNSVLLAGVTLVCAIAFGVPASIVAWRIRGKGAGRWVQVALTLPYAVPGTAVAVALILAFNSPTFIAGGAVLVGTFWILPFAYFIREYPLLVRSTTASLALMDPAVMEAAEGLGAGPMQKFRRVILPAVLPGVVSGGLLVVIAALGEFVSSILLYTYGSRPISVEILAQLRQFNLGAASAYAVLLMAVILLLMRGAEFLGGGDPEKIREPVAGI